MLMFALQLNTQSCIYLTSLLKLCHSKLEDPGGFATFQPRNTTMKKSKFTESQILFSLQQAQTGTPTAELRRMRQLEEENARLKKLVADLSLDRHMLQEVLKKKL